MKCTKCGNYCDSTRCLPRLNAFDKIILNNIIEEAKMRKTHKESMVEKFEIEYPNLAKNFKALQQEQYELFSRKNLSYGMGNISLGSNLETKEEKDLSITSIWIRCMDKMNRLKNLVLFKKENTQTNESIEDSWIDLGTYSLISLLVSRNLWVK